MTAQTCPVCDYPLPGPSLHSVCPECGADHDARLSASKRRTTAGRLSIAYFILMLPSCLLLLTYSCGWLIAHLILRLPNYPWVNHGEHPMLDVLGVIAYLLLLPSLLSVLVVPVVLPIALAAHLRAPRGTGLRRCFACLALLLATVPSVLHVAMMRPFGGTAWRILDWIPD